MSEPGKEIAANPFREVTDPDEQAELVVRSQGHDLRGNVSVEPLNPVGSIRLGGKVVASFPGVGPVSLSRLSPANQQAATRNIAEAIHHQFNVAQMIVWITQPTRMSKRPRHGRVPGPYTVHYVESCPALRRAKWAKVEILQRQPTGLPQIVEERGCGICARIVADEARRADQERVRRLLELPAPEEWYEVQTNDRGEPRWMIVGPELLDVHRSQVCVKAAFELEVMPHPESITREVRSWVDKIYVLDMRASDLDRSLASSVDDNPQTEESDGT